MIDGVCNMVIDLRPGEHVLLDGRRIVVELLKKSGKLARLRVTAPSSVKIEREAVGQPRAMRG
jgi:sRNA-binding carbon storage regulator CsrA